MGLSQMAWSLLNFRKWSLPVPLQGIAVAFPFILDQAFFSEWVKEKYENILTGACTLRPHTNITLTEKKAWLLYWSWKMREYLYTWDEVTIDTLFDRIVNAPKADEADVCT